MEHASKKDDADDLLSGLADELNDRWKDASSGLRDFDEHARAFVKQSPFVALGAALLGGFLLGRLLTRR